MKRLREAEIADLIHGIKILPLRSQMWDGFSQERNEYGGMTFSHTVENGGTLLTSTQLFRNRELWGIDSTLLMTERKIIPSITYEEVLTLGVKNYLAYAKEQLGYEFPIIVEAGAAGVKG